VRPTAFLIDTKMISRTDKVGEQVEVATASGASRDEKDESHIISPLITTNLEAYDIPIEGSLGILAMGYTGIMLWREKRYAPTK